MKLTSLAGAIRAGSLGLTSLLLTAQASAQGYYVDEQSALRLGDAFSGGVAAASDASTVFYGPAAMTKVRDELVFNLAAVSVNTEFDGDATIAGIGAIDGQKADADSLDLLPTFYMVRRLGDGFSMGAYINAPYATGNDFGDGSIARYSTTESEITGIDAGFALAFQVHDRVSIGGSIIAQYVNARTAVAVNTVGLCLQEADAATCTSLGIDPALLGSDSLDGKFEMEGHNTAFGFSGGALIDITAASRIGFNYRTRIAHELSGTATAEFPDQSATFLSLAGLGTDIQADGKVRLVTPENASLSYFHQLGKLSLQADYSWTRWSRYDQVRVESDDPAVALLASEPTRYNWTESHRIAIGGSYQLSPVFTLRSGMAFDKTPIRNQDTKVDFAFADYKAISFGMSYLMAEDLTLDIGLQHTFTQKRDIDQTDQGVNLNGEVTTEVNSFAAGLRWAM